MQRLRQCFIYFIAVIVLITAGVYSTLLWQQYQTPDIETITQAGVLQRIQHLNNLETVAFNIDTVVTSQREGTWNKLWQDEQRGLFVASGRVIAGLNLNKLKPEQVQVTEDGRHIHIQLPAVEILSSSLDKTEIYDIKTGLFGLINVDPHLLSEAQIAARRQIIHTACQSGILEIANTNAQKQIESLFTLTQAQVSVSSAAVPTC